MPVSSASSPRRRRAAQAGASMIELLVALLIFAFGMLGLAGLQTKTLVFNQSSLLRSQATALADDVFDRMRTDLANARLGNWATTLTTKASTMGSTTFTQTDLKDWKGQVEALLPSGAASITVITDIADADYGTATVVIQWDDTRGAESAQSFTTKTRL